MPLRPPRAPVGRAGAGIIFHPWPGGPHPQGVSEASEGPRPEELRETGAEVRHAGTPKAPARADCGKPTAPRCLAGVHGARDVAPPAVRTAPCRYHMARCVCNFLPEREGAAGPRTGPGRVREARPHPISHGRMNPAPTGRGRGQRSAPVSYGTTPVAERTGEAGSTPACGLHFHQPERSIAMARHPKRQRRLKPKHRRPKHRRVCTPSPADLEYRLLRERKIRTARRCLIALTAALIAVSAALCIFR